ncbi:hypothetical protein PoB_007355100 [Plakobranchus ocellatus]|uniref:Uncharacterized protein n=1 Tax=Plakobranchus ocellatus TaxID=259542 RepID=A0AAV4DSI5_9GAST|nr:hypothetical protein PoB_007355100 [Plakobranchus ocellatus]
MKPFLAVVAICFFAVYAQGQILLDPEGEKELKDFAESLKQDNLTQDIIDDLNKTEEFVKNIDVQKLEQMREMINARIDEAVDTLHGMDKKDMPVYILNFLNDIQDELSGDEKY